MLPNALQPNETDHVPVLAEEVRELLAIEPGQTVVDATFGAGGHAAVLAGDLKGDGRFIAIDRDPTVRPYFEGFRRHAGVQSRFLRGEASVVLDQLAEKRRPRRRDPARPRRLEHADRPAGARVLVRGRRAARHAHGPDRGAHRRRARQRGVGARARSRSSAGTARSATRSRSRARSGAAAHKQPIERTGELVERSSAQRFPLRRGSATGIRRSASSRRCGSRSTTSSASSRRRCPPRSRCCVPAAGSP